jgi:hypothetical protein
VYTRILSQHRDVAAAICLFFEEAHYEEFPLPLDVNMSSKFALDKRKDSILSLLQSTSTLGNDILTNAVFADDFFTKNWVHVIKFTVQGGNSV